MIDIATVARQVALPAVEAVFREGEITTLGIRADRGSVQFMLTVEDDTFIDEIVQAASPENSLDSWQERLRSNLVDFVAESKFGWGQNRETDKWQS